MTIETYYRTMPALCPDNKKRQVRVRCYRHDGSMAADTFFSTPANARVRGRSAHGYVTSGENGLEFCPHDVCKDIFVPSIISDHDFVVARELTLAHNVVSNSQTLALAGAEQADEQQKPEEAAQHRLKAAQLGRRIEQISSALRRYTDRIRRRVDQQEIDLSDIPETDREWFAKAAGLTKPAAGGWA